MLDHTFPQVRGFATQQLTTSRAFDGLDWGAVPDLNQVRGLEALFQT